MDWHRQTFANVSSRPSILRRVGYLENVGFLQQAENGWQLGSAGQEYVADHDQTTLLRIMASRNVGLRSLLYAISDVPMTISENSDQQLETHPELGWSRGETDMALQRVNWLRSMGFVQKRGDKYALTAAGRTASKDLLTELPPTEANATDPSGSMSAGTYETITKARTIDPEFRQAALARYGYRCPVSGVDHPALLDVAHVLPWSEYPDHRAQLLNVLALSKTHHAAFDRQLFTIDTEFRLCVNPTFETASTLLQETIVNRAGEQLALAGTGLEPDYLAQHNSALEWL